MIAIMKHALLTTVRILALTIVLFVLFAVAGSVLGPTVDQAPSEQQAGAAILLVVCLLNTAVVAFIVRRSFWTGWRLAAAVFFVLFGIMTFMSQIEAAVFPTALPEGMVWRIFAMGAAIAAPFSVIAVVMLGRWRIGAPLSDEGAVRFGTAGWAYRIALIVAAYLVLYFSFGYFVAWQDPAIREYYGGGDPAGFLPHMRSVLSDAPWLVPFQVVRAVIWALIGWLVVRVTGGRRYETPLAVGLAFAVLMNSQLLLPNPFMPEAVRMTHLLETASSNFLFGLLVGWLLTSRKETVIDEKPL